MADAKHDGTGWDEIDPFDAQDPHFWMKIEHLGRYFFAADYIEEFKLRSVADISCGTGYGTAELGRVAERVVGVDRSPVLLSVATERRENAAAEFLRADLNNADLAEIVTPGSLDAIVCFETLEHLLDPGHVLTSFHKLLKPAGALICSVPDAHFEYRDRAGLPKNRYHKHLFRFDSLSRLLLEHGFETLYRVGQSLSNRLLKRETELLNRKAISQPVGATPSFHSPETIRLFAQLLAYPTVEDVDGSYSIIVIARKTQS